MARLMLDAGIIVISAFISPYEKERQWVRSVVQDERFIEVFVNCSLETCELRDTKGLYAKARKGIIKDFTGISAPYEAPVAPDIEVNTDQESEEESLRHIIHSIGSRLQPIANIVSINTVPKRAEYIL